MIFSVNTLVPDILYTDKLYFDIPDPATVTVNSPLPGTGETEKFEADISPDEAMMMCMLLDVSLLQPFVTNISQ